MAKGRRPEVMGDDKRTRARSGQRQHYPISAATIEDLKVFVRDKGAKSGNG